MRVYRGNLARRSALRGQSSLSKNLHTAVFFMMKLTRLPLAAVAAALLASTAAYAGEADIKIPDLTQVRFDGLGGVSGLTLMYLGILLCAVGAAFGLIQYRQTKALPVHGSMSSVSNMIWETCKTYLFQQGKFLAILWTLIAACMIYYFMGLQHEHLSRVLIILLCSIL